MSNREPSDVGPAYGGDLRASDRDRDQVTTLLATAYAEGRLTREEHDDRQQAAIRALTFDDLIPLTRDLVALDQPADQPRHWPSAPIAPPAGDEPDLVFAVFGGTARKGHWTARRHLSVLTIFGGTEIDLRSATFTDNLCEISVFCLFGGVDIRVPDGVTVRNQCVAIFGGAGVGELEPAQPGAPTVVVKGFVGFGGVDVSAKRPKGR